MAKYTIELNTIVKSGHNIFNFPYAFFKEEERANFERLFVNHFYFREIGVETVPRFQKNLENTFNERLPYYNMLFNTALIAYEKTINYNLTETFVRDLGRTNLLTGNIDVDGTTNDTLTASNTLNRSAGIVVTGEKTSVLDSVSIHNENTDFNKNENLTENSTTDKTATKDTDNVHVESDTPNGLLAMTDIKKNVYASKAGIDDNVEKTVDKEIANAEKIGESNEVTEKTSKDTVTASSHDSSTDTTDEDTTETNNGLTHNNGSFGNTTNSTQNASGTENENYTKVMKGSFGVITEADMLKKHIDLQQTLTHILSNFFDECEDLFMQTY